MEYLSEILAALLSFVIFKYSILSYNVSYYLGLQDTRNTYIERNNNNVAYFLCSDGRGHYTQFIQLARLMKSDGVNVALVYINGNSNITAPDYFYKYCLDSGIQVHTFYGPTLNSVVSNGKVDYFRLLLSAVSIVPRSILDVTRIYNKLNEAKINTVINLLSSECSLFNACLNFDANIVCVGTQYKKMLRYENRYSVESSCGLVAKFLGLVGLNFIISLTTAKANLVVCLSPLKHLQLESYRSPNLHVTPVRCNLDIVPQQTVKKTVCVYLVYQDYISDIERLADVMQDYTFDVFTRLSGEVKSLRSNVHIHNINKDLFADKLAKCAIYMCTAGIESVCEALVLEKPIILVPTQGHYEQYENMLLFCSNLSMVQQVSSFKLTLELQRAMKILELQMLDEEESAIYKIQCGRASRYYKDKAETKAFLDLTLFRS